MEIEGEDKIELKEDERKEDTEQYESETHSTTKEGCRR